MTSYACGECGARFPSAGVCPHDGSTLEANDDPLIGTFVGRYRLTRVIGMGGMGCVYAAHLPDVGSRVAIKVISEHHARDPELAARFFAEARAVNLIKHENIVNVLDFVALPDGRPAIVMELLVGKSLRDIVKAGPVPIGGLVQLAIEVLSALAAAHAIGIVHRDLKPDNIMITTSGRVRVLDFGIAKLATGLPGQALPRTHTGVVLGTPEYMAPEQISSGKADHRTDLYAFAVVLFEALTGRRPFDGATDFEVMRAHVDDPPPSARALRPEIPVGLEQVVLCGLAKDPDRRFASAGAMANALKHASAAIPPSESRSVIGHGPIPPISVPAMPPPKLPTTENEPLASETVRERPSGRDPRRKAAPATSADTPRAGEVRGSEPAPARRGRWLALVLAATSSVVAIVLLLARGTGSSTPSATSAQPRADSGVADAAAASSLDAPSVAPVRRVLYGEISNLERFDPSTFLPRAAELARSVYADAELTELASSSVSADGHLDLMNPSAASTYVFVSPARARDRAGLDAGCTVHVEIRAAEIVVSERPTAPCDVASIPPPKCSLAQIWERAKRAGASPRDVAAIRLSSAPRRVPEWTFTTVTSRVFVDDCSVRVSGKEPPPKVPSRKVPAELADPGAVGRPRPAPDAAPDGCACRHEGRNLCATRHAPLCECRQFQPNYPRATGTALCPKWRPCTGNEFRCKCENPKYEELATPGEPGAKCSGSVLPSWPTWEGRLTCSATVGCKYHTYRGREGDACTGYAEDGELLVATMDCD